MKVFGKVFEFKIERNSFMLNVSNVIKINVFNFH